MSWQCDCASGDYNRLSHSTGLPDRARNEFPSKRRLTNFELESTASMRMMRLHRWNNAVTGGDISPASVRSPVSMRITVLSELNAISAAIWQQRHHMSLALASPQDVIEIQPRQNGVRVGIGTKLGFKARGDPIDVQLPSNVIQAGFACRHNCKSLGKIGLDFDTISLSNFRLVVPHRNAVVIAKDELLARDASR